MRRFLSLLALLCLFFKVVAQENIGIKSTSNSVNSAGLQVSLKIGDRVPDEPVTGVSGLKLVGKEVTEFRFSALRGRLVILDFWATWCAPCRAMVPVLNSLQKAFGDKILFLPVAYEQQKTLKPVLAAMNSIQPFALPGVAGDTVLNRLFPHRSLPHFVWIDGNGIVVAITEEKEVTAENLRLMLAKDQGAILPEKKDTFLTYDSNKPLFLAGNGGDSEAVRYHSVLSGYVPGLHGGIAVSPWDSIRGQRFTARNVPLVWLWRLAFGDQGRFFPDARIRLQSVDSALMRSPLSGAAYGAWLAAGHGFCYELLLPPDYKGSAFEQLRSELRALFPAYAVSVDTLNTNCLALVRTDNIDRLHSAGGTWMVDIGPFSCRMQNASLGQLVMRLERQFLQRSQLPIVDLTGYSGKVDILFDAPLTDVKALNLALLKYGLRLEERIAPVEMLVMRDVANVAGSNTSKPSL
jgi:thiol-disulfide isomerase/thioredoxin